MKIKSELYSEAWGEYDFIFSTEEECEKAATVLQAIGYMVGGGSPNLRATINLESGGNHERDVNKARKIIELL
jgi:hypothetical protein